MWLLWLKYAFISKITTFFKIIVGVKLPSHVQLFATPWTAAHQASLSFSISHSLLKLMSIELVMPSNHLFLYCPLLLLPSIFSSISVFSSESVLCIRWPKYWSFSLSLRSFSLRSFSPSNEYSWLISFRIECVSYFVLSYTQVTYSCWIPLSGMCCKLRVWDGMRNGWVSKMQWPY